MKWWFVWDAEYPEDSGCHLVSGDSKQAAAEVVGMLGYETIEALHIEAATPDALAERCNVMEARAEAAQDEVARRRASKHHLQARGRCTRRPVQPGARSRAQARSAATPAPAPRVHLEIEVSDEEGRWLETIARQAELASIGDLFALVVELAVTGAARPGSWECGVLSSIVPEPPGGWGRASATPGRREPLPEEDG